MSVQTIQKRILSDRQQDYAPEDEVIFNIGSSDVALLSGKNSYLRCEFTILKVGNSAFPDAGGQVKASLDFFGGGGFSLIDRMTIWSGDGATLLENLEEVPAFMGTKNYYDRTRGLTNLRNLLEGESGDDGTIADNPFSQYYTMSDIGEAGFQKVELLLPLRFSGVFYGKVFPIVAAGGLQVRIILNSAVKALKADSVNGMVVQRDRTGRLPELQDLPFLSTMNTNVAPFTTGTNPKVGNVSQHLPQCWELAHGLHEFNSAPINVFAQLVANPTNLNDSLALTGLATTTSGDGTGVTCALTTSAGGAGASTILTLTIDAVGDLAGGCSRYEPGDTVSIAAGLVAGATVPVVFTLISGNFQASAGVTNMLIKVTGVVGTPSLPSLLRSNVLAASNTCCNLISQHLFAVDDGGTILRDFAPAGITQVLESGSAFIQFNFAAVDIRSAGETYSLDNNIPVFGACLDPNIVAANAQALNYKVENIQLVCEAVEPQKQMLSAMESRISSGGGLSLDIKSYNCLKQNLFKNQVVSQQLLPTTEYRAKAVLQHQQIPFENLVSSYYEPVSDNLNKYIYQIRDKNVPNRKVNCDKEYSRELNTWNALCDAERTKCLTATGVEVRRETHPAGRFVFGRELAKASHSFNANEGTIRLTQDWGVSRDTGGGVTQNVLPQYNKLLLTFVPHFRKVTMKTDNVVVSY